MKRFLAAVTAIKERVALCYTAAMFFYIVFLFVYQGTATPADLLSMLIAGVAAGVMQVLAFSELIIKKLAYGWRMVVFAVPFFTLLTAIAVWFEWFPIENAGAWARFAVIFLVIFLAVTAGFEIYCRASGRRYDDRLDWYRKNRD